MRNVLYVLGFIVLIAGLALAAQLLGVSRQWIVIGIVILTGVAILSIASNMRERPPRAGD